MPVPCDPLSPANTDPKPAFSRKRWVPPEVTDLPRLTELTLQTGSPIVGGGSTGSGGSSVF
jgi:hypothetical protein